MLDQRCAARPACRQSLHPAASFGAMRRRRYGLRSHIPVVGPCHQALQELIGRSAPCIVSPLMIAYRQTS